MTFYQSGLCSLVSLEWRKVLRFKSSAEFVLRNLLELRDEPLILPLT